MNTEFTATIFQFEREVKRMQSINARAAKKIEDDARRGAVGMNKAFTNSGDITAVMKRNLGAVDDLRGGLLKLAPALAAAFSVNEAIAAADTYTRFTNQLKISGLEGEKLAEIQNQLFATAKNAGIGVEALGTLYARTSAAGKDLGANQSQLLAVTDAVALSLKVSGSSAESAEGALLQLGQALGAPKIQAQEYNSLLDGMPALMQAMAKASEEYGGSVAKMTADVKGGNVTSKEFFDLIIRALPTLQNQAAKATTTFGQAMATLQTTMVQYIGETDASLQITERMAQAIVMLSENLDTVGVAIAIVGTALTAKLVGPLITTRAVMLATTIQSGLLSAGLAGMSTTAAASSVAMNGLRASMAFLGGPVGVAILAISAAVAGLAIAAGDADRDAKALTQSLTEQNPVMERLRAATEALELAQGDQAKAAMEAAKQARAQAVAERDATAAKLQGAKASLALARANNLKFATEGKGVDAEAGAGQLFARGMSDRRQQKNVDALAAAIALQNQDIAKIDAAIAEASKPVATIPTPDGKDGKGSKSKASGPTAAEIADAKLKLELENELAVARAGNDLDRITALEREQQLRAAIDQFEKAGYADAEKRAQDLMTKLDLARNLALKYIVEASNVRVDGNPDGFVSSEDRMKPVNDAINDQADNMREAFRNAVAGGLDAAIRDGWPGLIDYMATSMRQRLMDNLLDVLSNAAFPKDGLKSGGIVGGAMSFLGKVFGGHANGTNFSPGGMKLVGERGPELMSVPRGAQVMPNNVLKSMGTPQRAAVSQNINFATHVHADGAVMAGEIQGWIARGNMQTLSAASKMIPQLMASQSKKRLI